MAIVESLLQRRQEIEDQIKALQPALMDLQRKIYLEISRLPMIYGRCIKEMKCDHQSDYFNVSDSTTINVGDIIEFFRYPLYNEVIFYVAADEYFTLPYSKEYFEFFTDENEVTECRVFGRD